MRTGRPRAGGGARGAHVLVQVGLWGVSELECEGGISRSLRDTPPDSPLKVSVVLNRSCGRSRGCVPFVQQQRATYQRYHSSGMKILLIIVFVRVQKPTTP